MEIDLKTVRVIFENVLTGKMSREQANAWAYSVKRHMEHDDLKFTPSSDEDRIWSGIMYLYGIDLLEAPGEYLHSDEDIRAAMVSKLLLN